MNRTVLVTIAVAAVFYLSTHNVAEKMTLFGFEFKDLTAAVVVLPVIFAYLYFEGILLAMRYSDLSELHSLVTEIAYQALQRMILSCGSRRRLARC
jgi:hypothetical protein